MSCYVYVYRDEAGVIRYVGKGSGARCKDHIALAKAHNQGRRLERISHFTRWLAKCLREGREFSHELVAEGLADEQAFELERKLIAQHKRVRQGGTLYNTLEGGEGFTREDARRIQGDPELQRKKSEGLKRAFADPATKARLVAATAEANGRAYRREQARVKALAEWQKKERQEAASQRAKELWADPTWSAQRRAELAARNKAGAGKPNKQIQKLWADEVFRKKVSERMKAFNAARRAAKETTQ